MGFNTKLSFLLLLTSCAFAQERGRSSSGAKDTCLRELFRFKNFWKYVYNYETETLNGVPGTADSRSGVKLSCKVELEVPRHCGLMMQVNQCKLQEVHSINADGKPIFKKSKESENFQKAMSQYELKFTTSGDNGITLYPHQDEPTNILNIKRGIISTLLVPMESSSDTETLFMDSIYGKCKSHFAVNSRRKSVATNVVIERDLTECRMYYPKSVKGSPFAILGGEEFATSSQLGSSQSCTYSLDGSKKHVTEAVCSEKHIFLPSFNQNNYGLMSTVKQTLKLETSFRINNRYFIEDKVNLKYLRLELTDSKTKSADSALTTLQKLVKLAETAQNQQRANLFQKFVFELRSLEEDTLFNVLPKLMETSSSITVQALPQCGTQECFSAVLKVFENETDSPLLIDTITYAMGLMPSPSKHRLTEALSIAKHRQSRATFYGLSHTARNFYKQQQTVGPELKAVADYMMSLIGTDCSGEEGEIYLTLKALGNMGKAMENANPRITSTLLKCLKNSKASAPVQQAAIQAFRQMTLTDEARSVLLDVYQDVTSPLLKRLGAYFMVMKNPSTSDLKKITRNLPNEKNVELRSFVSSHLIHILQSEEPTVQELKNKVVKIMKDPIVDVPGFSRHYETSKKMDLLSFAKPFISTAKSDLIFEPYTKIPKAVMLETTLNAFGRSIDLFELGLDGKDFDPSLEAIFGPEGFFPNSAMKTLYWVDGKVPEKVSEVLFNWFGVSRNNKAPKDGLMKELMRNFQKMMKEIQTQAGTPEANAFLRIFGNELGYVKFSDIKQLGGMLSRSAKYLQQLPVQIKQAIAKGINGDLFVHYMFLDSQFNFPTGAGFPLKFSLSGTIAPGAKAGIKVDRKQGDVFIKPSVGVEFVTQLGVNVPDFTRNAIQMNYNLYHESGFEAKISMNNGQVKLSIPAPKEPTKLLSASLRLSLLHSTKSEEIPSIMEDRQEWKSCKPLISGLNLCSTAMYYDSNDETSRYSLIRATRFVVQLEPTGTVSEYSATVTYQSPRSKEDLEHSVQLVVQAKGTEGTEATLDVTYNANTHVVTGDIQIPKFDMEFGVKMGIQDTSAPEKTSYALSFNVTNKNVPDLTLVGHVSTGMKDVMLRGLFSMPQLAVEAKTSTYFQLIDKMFTARFDADAVMPHSKASHQVTIQSSSKKAQVSWSSEVTSDIQIIREQIPDLSTYQANLQEYADQLLDRKMAQTDMTVKHIISKFMVAMNSWLKRASEDVPYVATFQNKLKHLQDLNFEQMGLFSIDLPEKLFLKSQGSAKFTFSRERISITIPIPFGGKVTKEIRLLPSSFQTPAVFALGFNIPSKQYNLPINSIPSISIPEEHTLLIPLVNKLEFSTHLNSNYYNWDGSFLGEKMSKKGVTQITANMNIKADSTLDLLAYQLKGNAILSQNTKQITAVNLDGSFHHKLLESSIRLSETLDTSAGKKSQSSFTWEASSSVGAKASLSSQLQLETKNSKLETQGNVRGILAVSSYQSAWNYTTTSTLDTQNYEAVGNSVLDFNSPLLQVSNTIDGEYTKGVFSINSNTGCSHLNFKNVLSAKMSSEEAELKCDTSGQVDNGNLISNIKWMVNKNGFKTENKLKGELFDANLENVALLEYGNSLLSLSLDTTGRYKAMETKNKLDLTASMQQMDVRHECLASYSDKQLHNILTGTFNLRGLEVKADTRLSGGASQAANKATLKIDTNGLTTGVISNVQISPLKLKHTFNAAVDGTKASMKLDATGQISENSIRLIAEGTADNRGIVASTTYQGDILDTNSNNIVNFKLNKEEGLVFNSKTQASYGENKLKHKNELSVAGWSLKGKIQTDSSLSCGSKYKHTCEVEMKPFTVSFDVINNFKYRELDVTHNGQLVLEPFKINFKGDLKGLHKRNQVTHTYSIQYADWVAALSTNTVGNIESETMRHKVDLKIAGLSAKFSSDSNCDSKSLQFTNRIRSAVVPFLFTFEANTNGRGFINVLGSHSGDLINKFQMKAAPLSLILVHDFRGTSQLDRESENPATTLLENKLNVMLNPSEQTSTWGLKSQLNRNTYVQNINAYNNPETIGMDITGQAMVDLGMLKYPVAIPFSSNKLYLLSALGLTSADIAEPKELQISGSLQYDKSKEAHVINIPFLEDVPIYFEEFKGVILSTLESIQNYLKNLDINQFVENYKKTLEKFPGQVNNFIRKLKLEQKINDARGRILSFAEEYRITEEDLEVALKQAQVFYQDAITQLQTYLTDLKDFLQKYYNNYEVQKAIENLINQLMETLRSIDKRYEITQTSIRTLTTLQDALQRFQLSKLQGDAVVWLQHIDEKHQIQVQLQNTLQQLKMQIQSIDLEETANRLKQQIASINADEVVEKLKQLLNTDKINELIDKLKKVLLMLMEDYEIMDKINSINTKLQEIIVMYEIGKQVQIFWDNTVQIIKKYKFKETLQKLTNILKSIDIKSYTDSLIQNIDESIKQIKSYNYEDMIEKINDLLSTLITKLKEFDYNVFVDEANKRIRDMTRTVNDKIQDLELPQKVEAVKDYVQALQSTVSEYLETLNQKKLSELIKHLSDIFRSIGTSLLEDMITGFQYVLEDLEERFSRMNIQQELQWYWQQAVQSYQRINGHLCDLYDNIAEQLSIWAERYQLQDLLTQLCSYLEEGFVVPELKTSLFTVPQFEVSLQAIRRGEFNTPAFTVPLTDLQIPSFHVNLKKLNSITIPTRFTIPQFTILKLVTVPDITIDLEKIKEYIVSTINNLRHFDISVQEINLLRDIPFPVISLPEIKISELDFSALNIPDIRIPKLNLDSFNLNDMQIPDFQLPRIPHTVVLPAFGKLTGTFNISSPVYTLMAKAGIHNSTTSQNSPVALAFLTAKAKSTAEILSFNFDATARLSAPELRLLKLSENIKLEHTTVRIDHMGTLTFTAPSIDGKSETTVKIVSEAYNAEAKNVLSMSVRQGLSTNMETTYNHNFNVPQAQISSQVTMVNIVKGLAQQTSATVSVTNTGSGRWSVKDFSDEGTHKSELKLNLRETVAVATFSGDTSTKYIKMKQTFTSEVSSLFHAKFALNADTDITDVGHSFVNVSGKGELGDLKMEVTAFHDANLSGRVAGTLSNSLSFTAQPFAIHTSTKNRAILKVSFPLTLIGKIDLMNNYELTLTSNKQLCTWQVNSKFNQYRYHHELSVGNDEESITAQLRLNGHANLDFLITPISIPAVTLPYSSVKTPAITGYSLWEEAGLKSLLKTISQSYDLSMKAQYKKNKDMHTFKVEMEPLYRMINNGIKKSVQNFEQSRDKALNVLQASYNNAKANYYALGIDSGVRKLPKSLHIPGYTIPLLNIDVSSYTVELPALGFVTPREITTPTFTLPIISFTMPSYNLVVPSPDLPLLHIPSSLYKLSLPKIKMPRIQDSIKIPAMGNLTYDFSFKSSVITLSASAGLFNQSDIVARYGASSSSVFTSDFKAEGTTSLTKKRGFKLATTISVNHDAIQGKHDSTVSFTKRNMEASVSTEAHVKLPHMTLNLKHDLSGNTKSKPNVMSRVSLDYDLSLFSPDISTQGAVTHSLTMEGLTSYFNLETTTDAQVKGSLSSEKKYTGVVHNEANAYLNSNGARATVKLLLGSLANRGYHKIWNITMNEYFAVDASMKRIYATWQHSVDNALKIFLYNGYGSQKSLGTLELEPWSLKGNLQAQMEQLSYIWGKVAMQHESTAVINSEIQKLTSKSKGNYDSNTLFSFDVQLSNNEEELRLDMAYFWQGSAYILKSITLPVYQKSLYSILKMDQTNTGVHSQYINVSTSIVCIKDGNFLIPLLVEMLSDGVKIKLPEFVLRVPDWVKSTPDVINGILIQYLQDVPRIPEIPEEINVPTYEVPGMNIVIPSYTFTLSEVKLPTVIITPTFKVPFTTLQIPSYTIDLTVITIPSKINTLPFDVTLPALPTIRFPKVSITSKYLEVAEYKIPYFEVTVPEFRITILPFSLPKSFSIDDYYVELDKITNYIANFDLPAITISEMTLDIPSLKFSLPAAIALPKFKSLTANVKVISPIYNTTWIASVANTHNVFGAALNATCSSTMQFLEYDLTATLDVNRNTKDSYSFIRKYTLKHLDFNVDWQENYLVEGPRMTCKVNIDVNSPTFTDLNLSWLQNDDGLSTTISSPTAGLLGLIIEMQGSEVLHSKLYAQKTSSPTTDLVILDGKVSLENPKSIQVQVNWRNDVAVDMLQGLKERVPKMTRALYNCVNKYHNDHFGMELSAASLKLKESINGNINEAYKIAVNQMNEVENYLQVDIDGISLNYDQMRETMRKMFKTAKINVKYSNIQRDLIDIFRFIFQQYYRIFERQFDSFIHFAKMTRFQPPGLDRPYTGQELYNMAMDRMALLEELIQKLDKIVEGYLEALIKYIVQLEIKVPSTDKIIKGSEILSELKEFLRKVQRNIHETLRKMNKSNFEKDMQSIKEYMKNCYGKIELKFRELENGDPETIRYQVHMMYLDILDSPYAEILHSDNVKEYVSKLLQMSQTILQVLVEKIQAAGLYVKAIREEHLDNFLFGWTAKFIEIEENVLKSLKELLDHIKEESPTIIDKIVTNTNNLKKETRRFVEMSADKVFNYLKDIQIGFEGKANINITEYLRMLKTKLTELRLQAKRSITEYKKTAKIKVSEAYDYFTESYGMLNDKAQMAIDILIKTYSQFMQTIYNFVESISIMISETTQSYLEVRQGQVTLNLPHNF
uniref:Apolipoprotein B n=1 Tax=Callorhinchus milii TaxID=7868 RepID=V9K7B7_CALMI